MVISLIVATDLHGVIGVGGAIPWHIPEDLRRFKKLTRNCPVIMGRKTYETIGKPLSCRATIVLSRSFPEGAYQHKDGFITSDSLSTALQLCKTRGDYEVFIAGGQELYKEAEPMANLLYLTTVQTANSDREAVLFRRDNNWVKLTEELFPDTTPPHTFATYKRLI